MQPSRKFRCTTVQAARAVSGCVALLGSERRNAEARRRGEVETSPHVIRLVAGQCIKASQRGQAEIAQAELHEADGRMKNRVNANFGIGTHHQARYARTVAE